MAKTLTGISIARRIFTAIARGNEVRVVFV